MRKKNTQKSVIIRGILDLNPKGYGFVAIPKSQQKDIFIPPHFISGAMHGDQVEVEMRENKGGKTQRQEGKIVQIIQRARNTLYGMVKKQGKGWIFTCEESANLLFKVLTKKGVALKEHDWIIGEVVHYPQESQEGQIAFVKKLGARKSLTTEMELILAEHQLLQEFPEAVLQEAKKIKKLTPQEIKGREDLRTYPFVTIDGENAKDFDDAIYVQKTAKGYELWVAIADVSHYVTPHTAMDQEAYARGTSVYFPHMCLPMLPEKLSNELCSLKPRQDRLTFVAKIQFNAKGKVMGAEFFKAVIRSAARLTYNEVFKMLIQGDVELREKYKKLIPHLETALGLYRQLRVVRKERGSIDFDLPEPEFILDVEENVATSIVRNVRNEAHFLIEEFMIAANEAVATFMEEQDWPSLYRVHENPDPLKISDFQFLIHNLGHHLPKVKKLTPKILSQVLADVKGKPYEKLVNTVMLRSLKQAVYHPENKGHFGLASKSYLHFTSPIRRYPDLVVHRMLADALRHKKKKLKKKERECIFEELSKIADDCSKRERKSMEAEYAMRDLQVALFMKDKVGEEFEGIISSVTRFGFFVELNAYFVEGLVRVSTLEDDYYEFDEKHHTLWGRRRKRKFRIGYPVKVRVEKVNIEKRKLDFILTEHLRETSKQQALLGVASSTLFV